MASTYVNDLRVEEIADGEQSGTWGATTNTNLELIAEALGYGTEAITTNANTHTSTIADGATDPVRAMLVEYTGTLDSACTITIAPDTINRMHFIANGTSGSQNIIIKQGSGSGAAITIPPGDTKAVYLDGAGSGAVVVDVFASLSVIDLKVQGDLTVGDDLLLSTDSALIKFGADADTILTHTDGTGLTLNSTNKLTFGDAASFVHQSGDGVLTIAGEATIALTASTAVTVSNDVSVVGRAVSPTAPVENDGNIDLAIANNFKVTPGGAFDLTFANPAIGQSGNILFINSGGHAIGAESKVLVAPATLTTISAAGTYLVTYYCTATSGANTILVTSSAILT